MALKAVTVLEVLRGGNAVDNRPKQAPELNDIPEVLAVIPTIDVVVFPHMVVPLLVLDEKIIKGINEAMAGSKKVLLLATKKFYCSQLNNNQIIIKDL